MVCVVGAGSASLNITVFGEQELFSVMHLHKGCGDLTVAVKDFVCFQGVIALFGNGRYLVTECGMWNVLLRALPRVGETLSCGADGFLKCSCCITEMVIGKRHLLQCLCGFWRASISNCFTSLHIIYDEIFLQLQYFEPHLV